MKKPYNWRTDYDWTDPNDEPVGGFDETVIDETELMLPKDAKGIKSLEGMTDIKGHTADYKYKIQQFAEQLAYDDGLDYWELSDSQQDAYYTKAFDAWKGGNMYAQGGRINLAYGPSDPGVVEDDLSTVEFMQDQGINHGPQASGIDPNINIEVVVEEFIKRKGRRPRSIEEIKEFYMKEMAGGSGEPQRVAYEPGNYDPIMVEEYERYKFDMNEQKPGFPVMEIDEFIQMQQEPKMGAAGGLSGILGA